MASQPQVSRPLAALVTATIGWTVWTASPVEAQDVPPAGAEAQRAEELYDKALAHFEARQWDEAATSFAAALALDPNPILAYNTGRAYEYTGDLARAEQYYLEALKLRPDEGLRQQLYATLERVTNLRTRVEDKNESLGLLEVTTTPPGATVQVNGIPVGQTPFQAAHPVGRYTVVASLDGHSELRREVEIKPGREVVLNATLVEETRLLTWISAGTGFAALGGGIWLGIEAQSTLDELDTVDARRRDPRSFDRLKSEGESLALGSVILYSVGGLALASAVVFYVIESPDLPETPPAQSALQWFVSPELVGVGGTW